jgi:hypothetical protein
MAMFWEAMKDFWEAMKDCWETVVRTWRTLSRTSKIGCLVAWTGTLLVANFDSVMGLAWLGMIAFGIGGYIAIPIAIRYSAQPDAPWIIMGILLFGHFCAGFLSILLKLL